MDDAGSKERRTGTEPLVPDLITLFPLREDPELQRLRGDVGDSAARSAAQIIL